MLVVTESVATPTAPLASATGPDSTATVTAAGTGTSVCVAAGIVVLAVTARLWTPALSATTRSGPAAVRPRSDALVGAATFSTLVACVATLDVLAVVKIVLLLILERVALLEGSAMLDTLVTGMVTLSAVALATLVEWTGLLLAAGRPFTRLLGVYPEHG
ncbi:hypothetical protein FOMPIDRAFT_1020621 [Fomitopsis schrenkii]|uniref:Uncharacterized protein n=1 Tax=Fomitopsis schrenkii TaxID=2126942 RepID=S8DQ65_FOMSC|nr:hypothetical protein FOMPIDRAFT_1020621 [Fomitopsis schrenkii]